MSTNLLIFRARLYLMKLNFVSVLFFLVVISFDMFSQTIVNSSLSDSPNVIPAISGPDTACVGYGGFVYSTQPWMYPYTWIVSPGGIITAGGTSLDNSVTVTWNGEGAQTVSVTYSTATGPGVLNVAVLHTYEVGVTVTPSENPVCAGTMVTYTASVVNGGLVPDYSWFVNGVNVGNNSTYSHIPTNNNVVHCQINSDLDCTIGNPASSPQVTMTVIPKSTVSVTVLASSNPSCEGSPVTFTAIPINGGISPSYQWKYNGILIAGATNSTYVKIPANGDVVVCELLSGLTCTTVNPVSSSPLIMTVSANQPVGVSIVASANPVCTGSQVVFSATAANGGTSPFFSWMVNGINAGTNNPNLTWTPANGDLVSCTMNSNAVCKTGNPANSNLITMVVEPYLPVNVGITASENPVCSGSQVTLTATPTNGGIAPHYEWHLNSYVILHDNPVYTYNPSDGDTIACHLTSNLLCASGNPAPSNKIRIGVSPAIVSSVTITASSNPTCAGTPILFTAIPVNGGTNPLFQWLVNGQNAGTNMTYTFTPVGGEVVKCQMTSSALCGQGTPVISNPITMNISPALSPGVVISASLNPVCANTPVLFTATPTNGGVFPAYQWKVNGNPAGATSSTFTYTPLNGEVITCMLTSGLTCAINNPVVSNAITMIVSSSLPVSASIVANSNPACQGQVVNFTASTVNGGVSPTYTWLVNNVTSGTDSSLFSYTPTSGDSIICYVISSYACASGSPANSNKIKMSVIPNLPVSIAINTLNNPSCQGSPVTYNATATNGGMNPVFQWRVNGANAGSNSASLTYIPATLDSIDCRLTSSIACPIANPVTSNEIKQTVYPILPAGISIAASANPVCTGTPVTFTATPVNAGTSPNYQWKLNGTNTGNNSPVLIYVPSNGNVLTCTLTSSLMCVSGNQITSNQITMVVSSILVPGINISAFANPFCQGSNVLLSSSPTNGGPNPGPTYQWLVNGIAPTAGTNSTYSYAPNDGDFINCRINSSLGCASPNPVTSNPILLLRNVSMPASVSITASDNPVCPGGSATFTATPVNGGNSPVYQWKVDGVIKGTNNPVFTYSPFNGGEVVTCHLTSNATCVSGSPAISNPITMATSDPLPASVFISTVTNPFCNNTPVTFNASPVNGGNSPTYLWRVNGTGSGTNSATFVFSPQNGDIITCDMTANASCFNGTVTSNPIVMADSTELSLSITITASANPSCQGAAVQYTATPVNGGLNPVYQWRVNNLIKSIAPVLIYTPVNGDKVTCKVTSSMVCANPAQKTSDTIVMTVNPAQQVSVSIVASSNPVCLGSPVTLTATPVNGGSFPVYQWRKNGISVGGPTPVYTYTPSNTDVITVTLRSNAYCVKGNPSVSNSIVMNVGNAQPVGVTITASDNPFCAGSQITYQATPSNGGTNPAYDWRVNGIPSGTNNPLFLYSPMNGDQITCHLTSNQSCISNNPDTSNTITMVATAEMPLSVSIVSRYDIICAGTLDLFTATVTNGGSNPTYKWYVNGDFTNQTASTYQYDPHNGDVVKCVVHSNSDCATNNPDTSNSIVKTVIPSAPVSISITASCNPCCQGTSVTYTATATNPGSNPLYRWKVNGDILLQSGSTVFTYIPANGNVVICTLTSNELCHTPLIPVDSYPPITMQIQPYKTVGVSVSASANPVCQGTPVTFTALPVNGGNTPSYQWKVGGLNAGSNSSTFTYTPVHGDVVSCAITSNEACVLNNVAFSNPVVMTVSPLLPASVHIVPSANPVCAGSVTFNATPMNGGPLPAYQWKVNGMNSGSNNPGFTYAPVDGDTVLCVMTSNAACLFENPVSSNLVVLDVVNSFPVSVTIEPSIVPPCQGSTVTFTASPVNGGDIPFYQWMINGMFVGVNSPTFEYIPNNGDSIECMVTSNVACATGNPAVSNIVAMNFSPVLPVSISITCSANPACIGTPALYSAATVNAGLSPDYHWKVNGQDMGVNLPQFSYDPANGDVVSCTLNSDIPCPLANPVSSTSLTMSVISPQTAEITISTQSDSVCDGSVVAFIASSTNQGSTPIYTWFVDGLPMETGPGTFSYFPVNGDRISCQLMSSVSCITNNPVTSDTISMFVSSEFPVSIDIAASANPSCLGEEVTYTSTAVNGGMSPIYQWMVNGINVGTDSPVYSYTPSPGQMVSCQLASSYSCATGSPAFSDSIEMAVNPIVPVEASIISSLNPACLGTPVSFNATVVNGGSSPTFQWKVDSVNVGVSSPEFTYTPANGDVVMCEVTSSDNCVIGNPANSNAITLVISNSFDAGVNIVVSDNPVCVNTPVTFMATPVFGGPAPSFQWKVGGLDVGNNSPIFSYMPVDGDVVTCIMTSTLTCATGNPATSNPITMIVLPIPVGVSIVSDTSTAVCAGDLVNFTAIPLNGGPSPTFQWKVNGIQKGTNSLNFTYPPVNSDSVTCILMSNANCASGSVAISNVITPVVNPNLPVSISIDSDQGTTVCNGTNITYSATTTHPGASPVYQWKVNGLDKGTNDPFFNYTPEDGDVIACVLTSNDICPINNPDTSNEINMIVNPLAPVGISITSTDTTVCAGTPVAFNAIVVNGGMTPGYQWKNFGINIAGATNSSYIYSPLNNDAISCELTSNATCPTGNPANSDTLNLTVNPLVPVSIIIGTSSAAVCAGTLVTFGSTTFNGGLSPVYQWKKNGSGIIGATDASYSYYPVESDTISCELTSSATCQTGSPATSDTLTLTVNPLKPVSIGIASSDTTVCAGSLVTFNSIIINGGVSPAYQWKKNGSNITGATNSGYSYYPIDHDAISCELTSNATCPTGNPANSDTLTFMVNPLDPVSIGITSSAATVCAGTLVAFNSTAVNGGLSPVYHWKKNGTNIIGATDASYSYFPANNDAISCELTSNATCPTSNPANSDTLTITVNPLEPVSIFIESSAAEVCAGTLVSFASTTFNGGLSPVYQWKKNGINIIGATDAGYSHYPVESDTISCELTSNATCPSGTPAISNAFALMVKPFLPVSVSVVESGNPICAGIAVGFIATPVNGGENPIYSWIVNGNSMGGNSPNMTYLPVDGDSVQCQLQSDYLCTLANPALSNIVTMNVSPSFPVSISVAANPPGSVCSGIPVTFTASPVNGGTNPQYQWMVNGIITGLNLPIHTFLPENNDTVTCKVNSNFECTTGNPATSGPLIVSIRLAPAVTYVACHDVQTAVSAQPFRLRGGLPLGGIYSGPGVNPATGMFNPQTAGAGLHQITYTYTTTGLCRDSSRQAILNRDIPPVLCGTSIIDYRDNNIYPTVSMGTQCWLGRNLNFGHMINSQYAQIDNCLNEKYCVGNQESNCNQYGGLYQWEELMQFEPSEGGQGLCPPGWHVPTDSEWLALFGYLGGQSEAGLLLKKTGTGFFNAIPGGVIYQNHASTFYPPGFSAAFFWSSVPEGSVWARSHGINNLVNSVSDYISVKENGFSVRCLRD